jgi:glyoxylase-like metal-dependent hydrolase (beta-lactamase superfamily II)
MRLARFAVAAVALAATAANAYAPQVKTQAPAYYRFMLGSFEITVVSDGTVQLPMSKLLTNTKSEKTSATLKKAFLGDSVETSVNSYLVNTGTKLVLIDSGAGALFGPTLGKLVANLRAAGYQPEQIDEIYITHAHPDHVGGLISNGAIVFPNATVRLDQADVDFWTDPAKLAAAPEDKKGFFQGATASLKPYIDAKKVSTFTGATELVPGIRAQPSHGHTNGHTTYVIESAGQRLVG